MHARLCRSDCSRSRCFIHSPSALTSLSSDVVEDDPSWQVKEDSPWFFFLFFYLCSCSAFKYVQFFFLISRFQQRKRLKFATRNIFSVLKGKLVFPLFGRLLIRQRGLTEVTSPACVCGRKYFRNWRRKKCIFSADEVLVSLCLSVLESVSRFPSIHRVFLAFLFLEFGFSAFCCLYFWIFSFLLSYLSACVLHFVRPPSDNLCYDPAHFVDIKFWLFYKCVIRPSFAPTVIKLVKPF